MAKRGRSRCLSLSRYLIFAALPTFAGDCTAAPIRRELVPELLEDPQSRFSIEDVTASASASRFQKARNAQPNLGYTRSTIWVRLPLPASDEMQPRIVELGYPMLDHVQFFRPQGNGKWTIVETGDRLPFASREIRYRAFLFRIPSTRDPQTVFLRIRTEGPMVLPITLWGEDALLDHQSDEQFLFGFYYAFLIALAAYNLFLFTLVRDRAYLYYVGYLGGFALFHASLSGHAFMYLWPDLPYFGNVAAITWLMLMFASGLLFLRRMTNTIEFTPRIHRFMGLSALCCLGIASLTWAGPSVGLRIAIAWAVLMQPLLLVPIISALLRRYRPARYVAIGYAAILPGGMLLGLRLLNVLPGAFWIEHAVQIGTALEALLLSFALADRINLLSREKAEAQASLIEVEREAFKLRQTFSQQLLEVQDDERKRIAADLHDGVGHSLVVLVNKLGRLAKHGIGTDITADLTQLEDLARDSVHELRGAAHTLYPHQLDRLGLKAAIEQVIERTLEPVNIAYEYDLDVKAGLLTKHEEIHVYRIIQEALNNIVRHSKATCAKISMSQNRNMLSIVIDNDGCGLTGAPGFGLTGMDQRARLLGGTLLFAPREPGGFTIDVRIPITAAAQ